MIEILSLRVEHQGLHDITENVGSRVKEICSRQEDFHEGLCTLFIQHTSASLLIQENCDPSAKNDLENWLNRLVPEEDELYTHTLEGPDDMPAHIKSALTATCLSIPIVEQSLALGSWQGIFLWEHRHRPGSRRLVMHLL